MQLVTVVRSHWRDLCRHELQGQYTPVQHSGGAEGLCQSHRWRSVLRDLLVFSSGRTHSRVANDMGCTCAPLPQRNFNLID